MFTEMLINRRINAAFRVKGQALRAIPRYLTKMDKTRGATSLG